MPAGTGKPTEQGRAGQQTDTGPGGAAEEWQEGVGENEGRSEGMRFPKKAPAEGHPDHTLGSQHSPDGGSTPSRSQVVSAVAASSPFLKCFQRRDEQPWLKESRGSPRHKNLVWPPLVQDSRFLWLCSRGVVLFTSLGTNRSAWVDLSCFFLTHKSFPKWSITITNVLAKHSSAFPPAPAGEGASGYRHLGAMRGLRVSAALRGSLGGGAAQKPPGEPAVTLLRLAHQGLR